MKSNSLLGPGLALLVVLFMPLALRGDNVNQAFQVARGAVTPAIQTHVVSIYGTGTPDAIEKWYIIFYDASVPSHGRAVLVVDNQIARTYAANGGTVYRADLTFDPSRLTGEGPALSAAQDYAGRHHIVYDSVRALLKQTSLDRPFRWRIELMDSGRSRGYVFINALDSTVASYSPADTRDETASTNSTTHGGNVEDDARNFGNDVKNTFLGIGGDLQEFFTGQRTVDKNDNQ